MECMIRPTVLNDAEQIFKNLFVKSDLGSVSEQLVKDVEKMKMGEFIRCVAVCNGRIVGQVEFTIPESPIKKHLVEMSGMVVMGEYQGKQISSRLWEFGAEWAKSKGVRIATLSVRKGTKAEEVYRHWGFEIYGELKGGIVEPWGDGKTYDELFMYKDL